MQYILLAATAICALSACGGATTGSGQQVTQSSGLFSSYSGGLNYVSDRLADQARLGLTPATDVDVTGTAGYTGAMFLGSRTVSVAVDAAVGDMTLDFDLKENSFSGSATDFVGRDNTRRSGTMQITNGAVTRTDTGVSVQADVAGSVLFGSDFGSPSDRNMKDLSGDLSGNFVGDDARLVVGDVDVSYEIDPLTIGTLTITELPLEAYFAVQAD
jgi:hypothetical protein